MSLIPSDDFSKKDIDRDSIAMSLNDENMFDDNIKHFSSENNEFESIKHFNNE